MFGIKKLKVIFAVFLHVSLNSIGNEISLTLYSIDKLYTAIFKFEFDWVYAKILSNARS